MTLGDGIVTATVLVLFAAGLYLIGQHRKWALAGKIVGVFFVIAALIGVGAWGLEEYINRPHKVTSFADVDLGMTPADVKIILGAPSSEKYDPDESGLILEYSDPLPDISLVFRSEDAGDFKLRLICDRYQPYLFDITTFSTLRDVLRRVGPPSSEHVNEDELSKLLIYENWNARFLIKRNTVEGICVGHTK